MGGTENVDGNSNVMDDESYNESGGLRSDGGPRNVHTTLDTNRTGADLPAVKAGKGGGLTN